MKYLTQNKFWNIAEDYDKEKLLYLLIDRPSLITNIGTYIWKNNKYHYHRDYDLPAYVWDNGDVWWYKNDILYRENNKPAFIQTNNIL